MQLDLTVLGLGTLLACPVLNLVRGRNSSLASLFNNPIEVAGMDLNGPFDLNFYRHRGHLCDDNVDGANAAIRLK